MTPTSTTSLKARFANKALDFLNDLKFRLKYRAAGENREEVITALKEIQIAKRQIKERMKALEASKR